MNQPVLLCADELSARYPQNIGLACENVTAQPWLKVLSGAGESRVHWQTTPDLREVWVASTEDVDAINVAAACKSDRPDLLVCLLAFNGSGSLRSRAMRAGIDRVLDEHDFVERYTQVKHFLVTGQRIGRHGRPLQLSQMEEGHAEGEHVRQVAPERFEGTKNREDVVTRTRHASQRAHAPLAVHRVPQDVLPRDAQPDQTEDWEPIAPSLPSGSQPSTEGRGDTQVSSLPQGEPIPEDLLPKSLQPAFVARPGRQAFFLPVVAGSGGSGKSTIAVLCALIAQRRGYKTLLLDLDMQFGNLSTLLGIHDAPSVEEVLETPALFARLEPTESLPALIAAPRTIEATEQLVAQLPRLLNMAFASFDVVIANTGGFWTEQHMQMLERSSKALFLIDQRPSSLRACQHALELCSRCGIAASPFVLGVNRCGKAAIYSSIDVSCALQGMPAVELKEGGREVEECLAAGQPLELLDAQNELCKSVERMLVDMLPELEGRGLASEAAPRKRARHFFGKQMRGKEAACL